MVAQGHDFFTFFTPQVALLNSFTPFFPKKEFKLGCRNLKPIWKLFLKNLLVYCTSSSIFLRILSWDSGLSKKSFELKDAFLPFPIT